jgi:methylenetetrahydrofolate dehydrogenase (NADP+)/methenyltetrahydrofolate cyclohydrolase
MESRRLESAGLRDDILDGIAARVRAARRPPGLVVVLVGDDPASQVYVRHKSRACERCGFRHATHRLPAQTAEAELLGLIERLNDDPAVDGILVQMPLPSHLDSQLVLQRVDPGKDVDGFHPENLGLLAAGHPRTIPCTPKGILRLLHHGGVELKGRHVVIVGRSLIVGRPLALLLSLKRDDANATVTICHSATRDLPAICRQAEILVAALGAPGVIGPDHVARGAVVVDVGINRIPDPAAPRGTRLVGDVAPSALDGWASAYTPVPGGVGPMTIAMLLENTWEAFVRHGGAP